MAAASLQDIVNAFLGNARELPYFHFHEALFKPFETLLSLDLCDSHVQDHVGHDVYSILLGLVTFL